MTTQLLASNLDEVAEAIAADLGALKAEFLPKAQATATLRASRSALSKWVGAAARNAGVPTKLLRRRAKNEKARGTRMIRIGSLPVSGGRLNPVQARKGYRLQSKRGSGRLHPTAFKVKVSESGRWLAKRTGASRLPLEGVKVEVEPAIRGAATVATARLAEQFPKEFTRAISVNLRRQATKRRRASERSAQKLIARLR